MGISFTNHVNPHLVFSRWDTPWSTIIKDNDNINENDIPKELIAYTKNLHGSDKHKKIVSVIKERRGPPQRRSCCHARELRARLLHL